VSKRSLPDCFGLLEYSKITLQETNKKSMVTLLSEFNQRSHPVTALQQAFQALCSWMDDTMSQYPNFSPKHHAAALILQTGFGGQWASCALL